MADIPSVDEGNIQEAEAEFKAAVSEYVTRRMGSNLNYIRNFHLFTHLYKMNGPISSFSGKLGVDGTFIFPYNSVIVDAIISIQTNGSSGALTIDVQTSTFPSGSYASIFSTIPSITAGAGNQVTCGQGDSVSGVTAPVITGGALVVAAKTRMKMNVSATPAGFPENAGIEIVYLVRG